MAKTAEWHDLRRKGIGGSDIPAILGLDPYKSPLEVYLEKRGELPPKGDNKHTKRGEILEPVIADLFAEETGLKLRRSRFSHEHPKYPWMRANIDRMILSIDDRGPGILEIKAPSIHAADLWQAGPPDTAFVQAQHYMEVMGWTWGYIAAWLGATDLVYYEIARDEALVQAIIEAEDVFWNQHVLKGVPPEGRISSDALARMYPQSNGKEVVLHDDVSPWLRQYLESSVIIKAAEKLKDEAGDRIKALMGEGETALYLHPELKQEIAVSWKSQKPYVMWDTEALDKVPDLVARYKTKVVNKRPLYVRVKEDKKQVEGKARKQLSK
jgi:putative phage-type endonuclease